MKIRPDHRDSPLFRQLLFDVFFSLSVIGVLVFFSVSSYHILLKKTLVLSHVLAVEESRTKVMEDFALTGVWKGREVPAPEYGPNIDAGFNEGAFHIGLKGKLIESCLSDDGKTEDVVSFRAVTPEMDELGPLIWITGSSMRQKVHGEQRGTLDEKYILRDLK